MTSIPVVVVTVAILPAFLPAQPPSSSVDLSCVSSLELPTRGLLAAGAWSSGTILALGQIGKRGQLSKLQLRGGNRGLQGEVRVAMSLSQFNARCEGRTVEFAFAFTLEDPPTDNIVPPVVRFVPPNRFELIFRRVKPSYDPVPAANEADPK